MTPDTALASAARLADMLKPGDLDATLSQITAAAVALIPDAAMASITVRHGDRLETVDATDRGVFSLDAAQYTLREGPCYDAATDAVHVTAPDLASDPRFPDYGARAVEAGINAQAAFRLFERSGGVQGALNLYSAKPGAFADLGDTAVLFRSQAAVAIAYAHEVSSLNEALETRTTIGQAMGIVMERYHLNDERAFAFLTRLSQHRNVKLRRVAEEIVAEAKDSSDRA
jgi:hypothetical protein